MGSPSRIDIVRSLPELKKLFRERGFPESRLLTSWSQIIGKEMALSVTPHKIERRKNENHLFVAVISGMATKILHFSPVLIERINGFFGYNFIHKIHIIQTPLKVQKNQAIKKNPLLTLQEKNQLETYLTPVKTPYLQKYLRQLGGYVIDSCKKSKTDLEVPAKATSNWRSLAQTTLRRPHHVST